jgi:hypothetical protein
MLATGNGARWNKRELRAKFFGSGRIFFVISVAVAAVAIDFAGTESARALPSFARQTGQPCGACHTDFPGLTPFGRQFKLGGYTLGGGPYRTTPFSTQSADPSKALASYAKKTDVGKGSAVTKDQSNTEQTGDIWVPPISMMTIVGFTHTQADQPQNSPYHSNNNLVVAPVSFFYGGAITEQVGAFAQVTYNNAAAGGSGPVEYDTGLGFPLRRINDCTGAGGCNAR